MIGFWVLAVLLIAIALCYVLPPLLQPAEQAEAESERANVAVYRDQFNELERDLSAGVLDQEQYEQGRLELQRRLLEDVAPAGSAPPKSAELGGRSTAVLLGSIIPLLAVLLYLFIGTPEALKLAGQSAAQSPSARGEVVPPGMGAADATAAQPGMPTQQEIESRVAKLAARLKENPNDPQGWLMLARSYQNFKRYREASDAYGRAAELVGTDAQLWADYADALAMANGSRLDGRPVELINKALELDPDNQKALWLAGTAAFEAQDFPKAISYWERLLKLLPAGSEAAQSVASSIEEARAGVGK